MSKIPNELPCPFCQGKMVVYFDREIYRNQALCVSCQSKMDLRGYNETSKEEYKKRQNKMANSQKNININK